MKVHTTNYFDTFIEVAEDCPVSQAEIPPTKADKTIANMQYEMISQHPYKFTSDEIIFACFAQKNDLVKSEREEARKQFFSKGQACLRASPLSKRYGWGTHHNKDGKVAIYALESEDYKKFVTDPTIKQVIAMRSKR